MAAKKTRVGVLMGGPSNEREISLITGRAVYDNLDREKYAPFHIEMTADRRFMLAEGGKRRVFDWFGRDRRRSDIVFIALHGSPGEDGGVQGMLETLHIPYTGSGILASASAMAKPRAAALYRLRDIPTPSFIDITPTVWRSTKQPAIVRTVEQLLRYPAVVKPADQGSAVGVSIVRNRTECMAAIRRDIRLFPWLIVQEYIAGAEATCGVLEKNGVAFALPPTKIIAHSNAFYDYASKYKAGGSTHICPADFSAAVNKKIQELALEAHRALGCRGMSRTDVIVAQNGALSALETNTIPGMTPTSLLPEAASKAGIGFSAMLDLIIAASL